MIVHVKIDDQNYSVEILDIHARPVQVLVDGESIEIWPEGAAQPVGEPVGRSDRRPAPPKNASPILKPAQKANSNGNPDQIKAPIPGVILSVAIRPGDPVEKGQELCILEAMKMKNMIRSPREGVIQAIYIVPGQTVSHGDLLLEFESSEAEEAKN